ncbi:MAG: hypothetical protein JXR03_07000 [Cyclobacteriaceae bacterium]
MKKAIYIILILFSFSSFAQIDSLRKYYKAGMTSYERADYQSFLTNMQKADSFRAFYPPIIYNIAAGYALTGNEKKAAHYLKIFLTFNSVADFQTDSDFQSIKSSDAFQSLITLQNQLSQEISKSQISNTISGVNHIEAIAINETNGDLFLGDVWDRKVYKSSNEDGLQTLLDFKDYPDLYSVMGLDFDEKSKTLWICSAALPQTQGFEKSLEGSSSIFSIDLRKNSVHHHGTFTSKNTFGDLIVSKKGVVYVSDGASNTIYWLDRKNQLSVFADLSQSTYNLQGLALSEDESTMFISDYALGIIKLDMKSKQSVSLSFEKGIPFKGIDGLYYQNEKLFAIQNGAKPIRIVQLHLNQNQTRVIDYKILDQNMKYLNEPTQGFLRKDRFIYLSNSAWAAYDDSNQFTEAAPAQLREVKIE